MEKDINIEMLDGTSTSEDNVQLPLNFITVGEIENDDVKVYIKQNVYKQIEKFAHTDTSRELGSILFGDYCEELGKVHVVISEFIEAKYTDASASTLTFTHETWDYVHTEQEKLYPNLKMLGWQHTHPNYGIFLSNYDMFIEENFFNMPFQVAYVVDSIQNIRGFFQWKNGKVEKLKGFYIYDEVGKPIKIEQTNLGKKESSITAASHKSTIILSAFLALIVIIGAFSLISMNKRLQNQLQQQEELASVIEQQNADVLTLQDTLTETIMSSDNTTAIEDLIQRIESQQMVLNNQEEVLDELRGLLEVSEEKENVVIFSSYTVQQGDTLSAICNMHGIDYQGNIRIIKALNGIENVNSIYVGQVIILPLNKTAE